MIAKRAVHAVGMAVYALYVDRMRQVLSCSVPGCALHGCSWHDLKQIDQYCPIFSNLHQCRKYNTYQLFTFISEPSNLNFFDSVVQKCALGREMLKMKIVLGFELWNFLLNTVRIIHANTYDSRGNLFLQF